MSLQIIPAQPEDAPLLKRICLASKGYWGYPDQWMAQFAATEIIAPESIRQDIVYKACLDGEVIGWYRLLVKLPVIIVEDLWIMPAHTQRGIGRSLFQHLLAQAQAKKAHTLELDADPNAVPFYQRMGCTIIGQTLTEWGRYIPHMSYAFSAT